MAVTNLNHLTGHDLPTQVVVRAGVSEIRPPRYTPVPVTEDAASDSADVTFSWSLSDLDSRDGCHTVGTPRHVTIAHTTA